jgi:RNA polymerase sigma-70 factor (ECF subfamily)
MGGDGDPAVSFEQWYATAHRQVLAALVSYCGDLNEAAEATDEAFIRAFAKWERVRKMVSPTGWSFVVARNVLRRRSRRHQRELEIVGAEVIRDVEQGSADAVLAAFDMARTLSTLSPRQRDIVVLHHGLDLSQEQVAKLLGISRSTVATTLMNARSALGTAAKGEARA